MGTAMPGPGGFLTWFVVLKVHHYHPYLLTVSVPHWPCLSHPMRAPLTNDYACISILSSLYPVAVGQRLGAI